MSKIKVKNLSYSDTHATKLNSIRNSLVDAKLALHNYNKNKNIIVYKSTRRKVFPAHYRVLMERISFEICMFKVRRLPVSVNI